MHSSANLNELQNTAIGVGLAHGKSILIGEHSVVYGAPAIAFPLPDLQVRATVQHSAAPVLLSEVYSGPLSNAPARMSPPLTAMRESAKRFDLDPAAISLTIDSPIPVERGLGSSAAVATAVVRATASLAGVELTELDRFNLVQYAEHIAHGTSSGLDAHAVVATGPLLFRGGVPKLLRNKKEVTLVIADTGTPGKTSIAVGGVRALRENRPQLITVLIERLAALTESAEAALGAGDHELLGGIMTEAHATLNELGVSSHELNKLVRDAIAAGALGAKMTGGGLGGCTISLARDPADARRIELALRSAGAVCTWVSTLQQTAQ
ncbi:mevalonate kinase [Canibacter sp. lx-45]|uniref:mevalonate kinase n=1 Tax=Canibacter zhuwentaonis TaxID=2837491 RepID=UPI001BDD9DCB|nr:mevalonate kinase [Canibacter zhuwentaonis]MBT1035759.1 mevalonate kinase [Canibacter zhuwentaonis]